MLFLHYMCKAYCLSVSCEFVWVHMHTQRLGSIFIKLIRLWLWQCFRPHASNVYVWAKWSPCLGYFPCLRLPRLVLCPCTHNSSVSMSKSSAHMHPCTSISMGRHAKAMPMHPCNMPLCLARLNPCIYALLINEWGTIVSFFDSLYNLYRCHPVRVHICPHFNIIIARFWGQSPRSSEFRKASSSDSSSFIYIYLPSIILSPLIFRRLRFHLITFSQSWCFSVS